MAYPGYPGYPDASNYYTDPYGGRSHPKQYPSRDLPPLGPPRDYLPPPIQESRRPHPPQYREDRVITHQPRMGGGPPGDGRLREWSSSLFDCTDDMKTCLCVLCNPFYECYLVEKFGESWLNVMCMGAQFTFLALRYKIRSKENIEGSLLEDCFTTTFCSACMICQLKRERDIILRTEGRLI